MYFSIYNNSQSDFICYLKLCNLNRILLAIRFQCWCARCNETILHLLRDCLGSGAIWEEVLPHSKLNWFFNSPVDTWLLENAKDLKHISHCDWTGYFLSIVWKARNQVCFNNIKLLEQQPFMPIDMSIKCNKLMSITMDPDQ